MTSLSALALLQAVYGGYFDPHGNYVQCRFANGERALLLAGDIPDRKTLVVIAANGKVVDPSGLRLRDGELIAIETNGGVASQHAIATLYEELSRLPRTVGDRAPRCRHPGKDGKR